MKKTPKDRVRDKWGTKDAAADAILALIGDPDGKTKQRIRRASNQQILDLYAAGETLKARFQSREGLEAKILEIKFPKGSPDAAYQARLRGYGIKRLLDLHRQLAGK